MTASTAFKVLTQQQWVDFERERVFRGAAFLYTLELANGLTVMAHVPSHHDHAMGEWIGIRTQVDHVVAFARENAAR